MPVLMQCPRCSFIYVKPEREANQMITCRRCQLTFSAAAGQPAPAEAVPPPPELFPFPVPVTIPATPTHFVLEAESVHEVEHIEVLDDDSPASPSGTPPPPVSLELESSPPRPTFDDVEIVAPPPAFSRPAAPTVVDPVVVVDPVPEPPPAPAQSKAAPAPPIVFTEVDEPSEPAPPPPVPRRERPRNIDIRKRPSDNALPVGAWIGLVGGAMALLILVVVLIAVLSSGSNPPAPVVIQPLPGQVAAPPVEQFLPRTEEWPTPPDQRGPAPWMPPPFKATAELPTPSGMEGLIGYWPLDEAKGSAVADGSTAGHKSTLVGGWWIDGVRGKALFFDGRRDYLDLGAGTPLNFAQNAPFTIAGWFATRQRDGYVLAFRNPRNVAPMIQVKLSGGALCGVVRADGSDQGEARVGLAPAADGQWHHFALVRHAGGMIECWLDGKSLDKRAGANTLGPITTTVRAVGCERARTVRQPNAAAYCACAVDELCIFNRALAASEIIKLTGR